MKKYIIRIMMVFAFCLSFTTFASAQEIIGAPESYSVEGNHDGVYYKATIFGSGATCWIELDCGRTVSRLESFLNVSRSKGLWYEYDVWKRRDTKNNASNVYTRWDDGGAFVALKAWGTTSMNGTQVESLIIDGWW